MTHKPFTCSCDEYIIDYDADNKFTLDHCYIDSDADLLIVLYKILVENQLKLVFQRLTSNECHKFVTSGALFAIVEKNSFFSENSDNSSCSLLVSSSSKKHFSDLELQDGITRWTDKLLWTSSRMLNKKFLVYKQKNFKSEKEKLIKKTFSIKIDGKSIRLISYYSEDAIDNGSIKSIKEIYPDFFKTATDKKQVDILKHKIKDINISGYANTTRSLSETLEGRLVFTAAENTFIEKNKSNENQLLEQNKILPKYLHLPPPNVDFNYYQTNQFRPTNGGYIPQQLPLLYRQSYNIAPQYYLVPQANSMHQSQYLSSMPTNFASPINQNSLIQCSYPNFNQSFNNETNKLYLKENEHPPLSPPRSSIHSQCYNPVHHYPPNISQQPNIHSIDKIGSSKITKTSPKLPSIKDLQLPKV
ncbi:hypothetical protein QEN19_004125 [Hanseniaspora menglaensis]